MFKCRKICLTGNRWNRALFTRPKKQQNFGYLSNCHYCAARAQNLQGPAPNNVLMVLQISSKSVHFRQSYSRTREHIFLPHWVFPCYASLSLSTTDISSALGQNRMANVRKCILRCFITTNTTIFVFFCLVYYSHHRNCWQWAGWCDNSKLMWWWDLLTETGWWQQQQEFQIDERCLFAYKDCMFLSPRALCSSNITKTQLPVLHLCLNDTQGGGQLSIPIEWRPAIH